MRFCNEETVSPNLSLVIRFSNDQIQRCRFALVIHFSKEKPVSPNLALVILFGNEYAVSPNLRQGIRIGDMVIRFLHSKFTLATANLNITPGQNPGFSGFSPFLRKKSEFYSKFFFSKIYYLT